MRTVVNVNFVDAFSEADHPREGGKFTSKSGGGKKGQTGSHEVNGVPYTTHQKAHQKSHGIEEVHRYGSAVGAIQKHAGGYRAIEQKLDGRSVHHGDHPTREAALKKVHHASGGKNHEDI